MEFFKEKKKIMNMLSTTNDENFYVKNLKK